MGDLQGFDWNAGSVGHILRHGITSFEVAEALGRPHATIPARNFKGETR